MISDEEMKILLANLNRFAHISKITFEENNISEIAFEDLVTHLKETPNIIELKIKSQRDLSKI